MTSPEDLITYLLIKHLNSLQFISNKLSNVENDSQLTSIGEFCVIEAILQAGYKTRLKYQNISGPYWKPLSGPDVFSIQRDSLFGQRVTFDIDLYRELAGKIQDGSEPFKRISKLIDDFGQDGFNRALAKVANEKKWEIVQPKKLGAGAEKSKSRKSANLSQREIDEIIADIARVKVFVDDSALMQSDRAQVLALADSALALAQSPSPPWDVIKEILFLLAAVSTTLAFVIPIIEKIG